MSANSLPCGKIDPATFLSTASSSENQTTLQSSSSGSILDQIKANWLLLLVALLIGLVLGGGRNE